MLKEIILDGVTYTTKQEATEEQDGRRYCIIRTYSAGVFAGYIDIESIKEKAAYIYDSRRIFYWTGACSLSQLATEGSKDLDNCKIAVNVSETFLSEIIEVIPCYAAPKSDIQGANEWKK